jgi:hypothetical protein
VLGVIWLLATRGGFTANRRSTGVSAVKKITRVGCPLNQLFGEPKTASKSFVERGKAVLGSLGSSVSTTEAGGLE